MREQATRRLAAILAADVAGYTRLMAADEQATLTAWWQARREIIDPSIAAHGGRIVKHTGDGFLAEFTTATEAVRCAAAMQGDLARMNEGAACDHRFDFRMGINVGEIVSDDEDIYGDGVNIAARLESLADAGGICLSAIAHDQVKGTLDLDFEYLGAKRVKHVAEPLRHYRVMLGRTSRRRSFTAALKRLSSRNAFRALAVAVALVTILAFWPSEQRPSGSDHDARLTVSVESFRNIGEAGDRTGFGEGLTEDLLAALSARSGLRVVSDGSASAAAAYLLQGSVRWVDDKVRVSVQLVEANTGFHLWGGRYDRVLVDVLDTQSELATKVVSTLSERLAKAELERRATTRTPIDGVQAAVYRGLENLGRIAEAAAFLPRELIDWLTGAEPSEASVEGDTHLALEEWR